MGIIKVYGDLRQLNNLLMVFMSLLVFSCISSTELEENNHARSYKREPEVPQVVNYIGETNKQTNNTLSDVLKPATNAKTDTLLNEKSFQMPILGIDVSHFQGKVNWEEVKTAGIDFAYAKATQGAGFKDPRFTKNIEGARKSQLAAGAYHFYMIGEDVNLQITLFLEVVGKLKKGDMPPMLDLEQGSIQHGVKWDVPTFQKNVLQWLQQVEKKIGVQPIIYTNKPFANAYLRKTAFSNYKLWLAEYEVEKPTAPITWQKNGWCIWQRAQRGHVNGVAGNVDHDIFNGNVETFLDLLVD